MKDKTIMMYDHIKSSADVDSWAIEELKKVLAVYLADGCAGCAYEDREPWAMPCSDCSRNVRDCWRAKE